MGENTIYPLEINYHSVVSKTLSKVLKIGRGLNYHKYLPVDRKRQAGLTHLTFTTPVMHALCNGPPYF